MKRFPRSTLRSNTLRSLLVLSCLSLVSGCVTLLPDPEFTQHTDSFVVVEAPRTTFAANPKGMLKICQEFYRHYEDEFDVLVLVSHTPDGFLPQWGVGVRGGMLVVRHSDSGTGTSKRDFGQAFGSASRLKGVVHLSSLEQIVLGPLLHEFMHLWFSDLTVIPSEFVGHWGFSSVGGQLGGFQLEELETLGRGKYIAGNFGPQRAVNSVPYSDLEMYLAGWLPPTDVPEIWVAEDGQWSLKRLTKEELEDCKFESGPFMGELDEDCIIEKDDRGYKIFVANKISTWNVKEIIRNLGPRKPNFENSQKNFRAAFILVTGKGNPFSESELATAEHYINQFTIEGPLPKSFRDEIAHALWIEDIYNFWEAARGEATLKADELQSFRIRSE